MCGGDRWRAAEDPDDGWFAEVWRRLRTDAGPLYGAVRAAVRRRR
ncbi:MAG: hypothetical protein RI531_08080 [Haloferacaceae archaeon]|nr:hypothetical protein [Haloferacaceae archaeon]